jgi:hypothetical protein
MHKQHVNHVLRSVREGVSINLEEAPTTTVEQPSEIVYAVGKKLASSINSTFC